MPPLFSIVIPAYNAAGFLQRPIESVLHQDFDDYEIVVVDDGSTDQTAAMAADYVRRDPGRIRVIRQPNRGPGAARNRGAAAAGGKYLLFLDADDELLPTALATFYAHVSQRPDLHFIFGGHYSLDLSGRLKAHCPKPLSSERSRNFIGFLRGRFGSIAHGSAIIKRPVFKRLQYPETIRNNEDLVLFAQLLALYDCASFAEAVAVIHKREDSLRRNTETITATGIRSADLLFDPAILPDELMRFSDEFIASRYLSQFRALYRAGRYREAKELYHRAIRTFPLHLLQLSPLRKYLRLLLKRASRS